MKKTLKSIGAVFAGVLAIVILSNLTDFILQQTGVFPDPTKGFYVTWMIVLAIVYRNVYAAIGGYITAALAPSNAMRHVLILGIIGVIASGIGLVTTGDKLGPIWYPIALVVFALPSVWFGGKLRKGVK